MAKTIPYVTGTINPIQGCVRYSRGCRNCYAHVWATRFRKGDFGLKYFPMKVDDIRRKKGGLWFVGSMTDMFQDGIDTGRVFDIMEAIDGNTKAKFLMLTKRAQKMADFFANYPIPGNLGIGVTAEGQAEWDERVPVLLSISAPMRWVSIEPMLEPVVPYDADDGINWIICGPETGAKKRLCDPFWITQVYCDCGLSQPVIPFFDKRDNFKELGTAREWPKGWQL